MTFTLPFDLYHEILRLAEIIVLQYEPNPAILRFTVLEPLIE